MSSRSRLLPWVIVATAMHSIAVPANPVDDLLPGHWLEVPDSRLDALDPEDDPTLNPNWPIEAPWHGVEGQAGIMDDWSSAAYDTLRDRLAIWGGGHSGYAGNEVYVFDVETLHWERVTNPSVDVAVTGTTLYPDGQPRARETYNYLHYLPQLDRMMSFGGGNLYPCCNDTLETAAFDFATRTWNTTSYAPRPEGGSPFSAIAAVDDATGHVWYIGSGLNRVAEFDPAANHWSLHAEDNLLLNRTGAIDPVQRRFVWFGGFGDTIALDLDDAEVAPAARATTGDKEIELAIFPGFVYDPVRRVLVAWNEGSDIYTLDAQTWRWTRVPADPANTVVPGAPNINGTFGRFRYVPSKDVFILVNGVSQNVYFYRMPSLAVDSDADGLLDTADDCLHAANGPGHPDGGGQSQLDSDGDGIGNACDADIALPNDCRVTSADLATFKRAFYAQPGRPNWNPSADFNGDGRVNFADMTLLRTDFQHSYFRGKPEWHPE